MYVSFKSGFNKERAPFCPKFLYFLLRALIDLAIDAFSCTTCKKRVAGNSTPQNVSVSNCCANRSRMARVDVARGKFRRSAKLLDEGTESGVNFLSKGLDVNSPPRERKILQRRVMRCRCDFLGRRRLDGFCPPRRFIRN